MIRSQCYPLNGVSLYHSHISSSLDSSVPKLKMHQQFDWCTLEKTSRSVNCLSIQQLTETRSVENRHINAHPHRNPQTTYLAAGRCCGPWVPWERAGQTSLSLRPTWVSGHELSQSLATHTPTANTATQPHCCLLAHEQFILASRAKKGSPSSITERRVPEPIPVLGS